MIPREFRRPLLAGALLALASWAVFSWIHVFAHWLMGDARNYEVWGNLVAGHAVPYRDFKLEYPPGSLPAFVVPIYLHKLARYHGTYFDWLRAEILVLHLACLWTMAVALARLGASRRHAWWALCLAGAASGILGPIAYFHYDWWPAFLMVAALAALLAERPVLAVALASLGASAKVYPALLLPFAAAELWRRSRWRGLGAGAAAAAGVFAVTVLPFVLAAPNGIAWAIHREASRPLEVESVASSAFVAAHHLAGYRLATGWVAASRVFLNPGAHDVVRVLTVLTVVSLVAVYALWWRSRRGPDELVLATVAAVLAYVVCSKVFSPQYLVWLIPLVPLLRGRVGVRATALFVVVLGWTQVFEPYRQGQYWLFRVAWVDFTVVARNVLVVALFVLLLEPLVRAARARRAGVVAALQPE